MLYYNLLTAGMLDGHLADVEEQAQELFLRLVEQYADTVGVNIQEKATMIWNVADVLRGSFKPHEYGLVILPMTVVKRFHDCLLPIYHSMFGRYIIISK